MPINPLIPLQGDVPNTAETVQNALLTGQQFRQSREEQPLRNRLLEARTDVAESQLSREDAMFQLQDAATDAMQIRPALAAGDIPTVTRQLQQRIAKVDARGGNSADSRALLLQVQNGDLDAAGRDLDAVINASRQVSSTLPAGQREFEALTGNLSAEDLEKARRIKLRLDPGAVGAAARTVDIGGVPHTFDPVTQVFKRARVEGDEVTTETVSESEAIIAGSKKAAEKAVDRSDKILDELPTVRLAITNIDSAVQAIDDGAKTGVIASKLPSFRPASIKLDNLRGRLGLDVISGTTFGALSEAELKFALATALPTNLDPPELRGWLLRKKATQEKLAAELESAAIYLGTPGNTAAGYLEKRRNDLRETPTTETTGTVEFMGFEDG